MTATTTIIVDIFQEVVKMGIPFDHHESDLYILSNDLANELISRYEFKCNVTRFKSQIDNKIWFDIPFAYTPHWCQGQNK